MGRDHGQATPEIEKGQSRATARQQQGSEGQAKEDPHLSAVRSSSLRRGSEILPMVAFQFP
jgi:hypothetical protein